MAIQHGNVDYSGEVTITQTEYEALKVACGGNVLAANFDIVVCYGDPSKGLPNITDTLLNCEITEDNTEWAQGDKFQEKTLPIIFLDIKNA
jgi:hypothetical protein